VANVNIARLAIPPQGGITMQENDTTPGAAVQTISLANGGFGDGGRRRCATPAAATVAAPAKPHGGAGGTAPSRRDLRHGRVGCHHDRFRCSAAQAAATLAALRPGTAGSIWRIFVANFVASFVERSVEETNA
jgi:hypothetical protein